MARIQFAKIVKTKENIAQHSKKNLNFKKKDSNPLKNEKQLKMADIAYFAHQMARALVQIHSKKINHFDFKLENLVFFKQNKKDRKELHTLKLIDFEFAEKFKEKDACEKFALRGTVDYVSPEILLECKVG